VRQGWVVVAAEMEKFARSFLMPLAKWHQVSVVPQPHCFHRFSQRRSSIAPTRSNCFCPFLFAKRLLSLIHCSQNRLAVQLNNYGLKYDDIRNEAEAEHEASIAVCLFLRPPLFLTSALLLSSPFF
jgi:hypothetical protein